MAFKIKVKPIVYFDTDEAIIWYEDKSPGLGKRFLSKVDTAKNKLMQSPYSYGFFHKNVRRIAIEKFPYKMYFIIQEDTVLIVGIAHGKRNKSFVNKRLHL